jgi:hypothetical protein
MSRRQRLLQPLIYVKFERAETGAGRSANNQFPEGRHGPQSAPRSAGDILQPPEFVVCAPVSGA